MNLNKIALITLTLFILGCSSTENLNKKFFSNPSDGITIYDEEIDVDNSGTIDKEEFTNFLLKQNRLLSREGKYYKHWHTVDISDQERSLLFRLLDALSPDLGSPSTPFQLAKDFGIEVHVIDKIINLGIKKGYLILINKNRCVPTKSIKKLRDSAEVLASRSVTGSFTIPDFRDETGIGRNFAVEILEYFDQIGFTIRVNNVRRIDRI